MCSKKSNKTSLVYNYRLVGYQKCITFAPTACYFVSLPPGNCIAKSVPAHRLNTLLLRFNKLLQYIIFYSCHSTSSLSSEIPYNSPFAPSTMYF